MSADSEHAREWQESTRVPGLWISNKNWAIIKVEKQEHFYLCMPSGEFVLPTGCDDGATAVPIQHYATYEAAEAEGNRLQDGQSPEWVFPEGEFPLDPDNDGYVWVGRIPSESKERMNSRFAHLETAIRYKAFLEHLASLN